MAKQPANNIFLGPCPLCRKKLGDKYLRVIERQETAVLCHVKCGYCKSSIIFSVSNIHNNVITTVGILTDIQPEDLEIIRERESISVDDVLAIHQFLKENNENKGNKKGYKR